MIAAVSLSSISAPVSPGGSGVVKNNGDGLVLETLGKLKVSEIDGKNVTSMYGSGPGEGEVLNRVHFGGTAQAEAVKASVQEIENLRSPGACHSGYRARADRRGQLCL